jgi:polyhydroxyalkanoate synthesis regulator phasin
MGLKFKPEEDDPPLLPTAPMHPAPTDPEALLKTEPPPAEPGTESAPDFPRAPPLGTVGIETILYAIRDVRESVDARIDRFGVDVTSLIRKSDAQAEETGKLTAQVNGVVNAVNKRRERDDANQDAMRTSIHNLGSAFETFRSEFAGRFDSLERRVAALEDWRDSRGNGNGAAQNG